MRIELFDFCQNQQLCEMLVSILRASFENEVSLHCDVVSQIGNAENTFLKKFELADPHLVLLVFATAQVALVSKLIRAIKIRKPHTEIILITEECDANDILNLMSLGAADFIISPINASATTPRVAKLLQKLRRHIEFTQSLKTKVGLRFLVGNAPIFLAETRKIPLLASCDGRVLILGETGTGKELFARAIHYLSARSAHPFVAVSCGAIPVELVENEMFGHNRGAFTGATTTELGLISEAEGGTLFLDEIDCLPILAQTKLLRFLQEGEYKPLGSTKSQHADVRVITASNLNLEKAVKDGKLRQDLYYRLNIGQVKLPSLRDRSADIPLLAEHFLAKYVHEFDRTAKEFSEAAMRKLILYNWPGNIRELENTIERAVMLSEADCITDTELLLPNAESGRDGESFKEAKARVITHFERTYIQNLMRTYRGNVSQAARAAQKHRRALWQLVRKHKVDVSSFRNSV